MLNMPPILGSASILVGRLTNNSLSRSQIQSPNVRSMLFCTCYNSENGRNKRTPSRSWFYLVSALIVGASGGVLYNRVTEKRRTTKRTLEQAVQETRTIIQNLQTETGCPGVSVAVSKDGLMVMCEGFGHADVENGVPCTPDSVMKIASISKPITMALLARQWERDRIDIDAPIGLYVNTWPRKTWDGKEVAGTVRMLTSHMAGVRDYRRMKRSDKLKTNKDSTDSHNEFAFEEYYIKDEFESVSAALELFKDDPLVFKPGSEFHYTTHGFTLVSAALEGATGRTFPSLVQEFFEELGMPASGLDDKERLVYNRARGYSRDDRGVLQNAPYTSSSFKWAGAGLVSTVKDLVCFGNIILYSFQHRIGDGAIGYLEPETVRKLWTPVVGTAVSWDRAGSYGMGWQIVPISDTRFCVGHTGGTIGASCALMLLPAARESATTPQVGAAAPPEGAITQPEGVVVAVLTNLQSANLGPVAVRIASIFDEARAPS